MLAVRCLEYGPPEKLRIEEIPRPAALESEVLVRVGVAALNFPDVLMIQGQYQVKPPVPFTPGFELCGTIEALGPGTSGLAVGDRVLAQCDLGAFAEYVAVPAISIHPVPAGLDDQQAAAFPLVYQTSYFGLVYRGGLKPGEHVLVHSAAGGVGLAAVQLARALGAGRIIGTVGSDEKLEVVREAGADEVVNYRSQDFVDVVKRATDGRGADVIYDPVGGEIALRSTKCIAFEGRLVIVGFTSGQFTNFASNHILIKNYSVVGLHWGYYRQMKPEQIEAGWRELVALYDRSGGALRPRIGARYSMRQAAAAFEHLASRQAVGKIVLAW